jgi:hypothetical protein
MGSRSARPWGAKYGLILVINNLLYLYGPPVLDS